MVVPVPDQLEYISDADGVTKTFPYPKRFLQKDEIVVMLRDADGVDTVQRLNIDYTISGSAWPTGGDVVFNIAPASGLKVVRYRMTQAKQTVDLENKQRNDAPSVELQLDRLTMAIQDRGRLGDAAWWGLLAEVAARVHGDKLLNDRVDQETIDRIAGDEALASLIGNVGSGNAPLFDTRLAVSLANIDPLVNALRTAGYNSVGDGGSALYKRVDTEPTHAGKVQSADGAWWEAAGGITCESREALQQLSIQGFRLADGYIADTPDGKYVASNRPAGTQLIEGFDNPEASSEHGRYVVAQNSTLTGLDGKRFVVKGVQMFDYLFASFEARDDNRYRKIYQPVGKGPLSGISEPTYYARLSYKNREWAEEQIMIAISNGVNLIRVGVEPAVMFASVPYVDDVDGKTYPSDIEMLDTIIEIAANKGIVVQLQQSNDVVETAYNQEFMRWLVKRYFYMKHVWINPMNEPLGYSNGGANVNSPTAWNAKMSPLVAALQEDIPDYPVGTKWQNPIVIDPPSFSTRLDLIKTYLSAAPFNAIQNMIINTHIYGRAGDYNFMDTQYPIIRSQWLDDALDGQLCVVIGEVGINNFNAPIDPDLDPGIPSSDPVAWSQMQSFTQDFFNFVSSQIPGSALSGVIGHMWFAYIEGLSQHDYNSIRRYDGTWTAWGQIYRSYYLTPFTTPTITYTNLMQKVGGLQGAAVGTPSTGSPTLQAEGRTGNRAAMLQIAQVSTDTYTGFYNRATDAVVGSIVGTSGGGVVYNTTSDARLKGGVRAPTDEEVIAAFSKLHGRKGHYLADPDEDIFMFVAQELEGAVPNAVTKPTNEKDLWMADYSATVPLIAAALRIVMRELKILDKMERD